MSGRIYEPADKIAGFVRRFVTKHWYRYVSSVFMDPRVVFLNYGYADLDGDTAKLGLQTIDEPNRYSIQLYHHAASAIDLNRLGVLEVSCGHGGGASYMMRYLKPKFIVAVDRNGKAMDSCKRHSSVDGLSFSQGDAESLQFLDNTFDVIVNVEASHCYGDMDRFLSEVARVLRPGGYFLFADIRFRSEGRRLHEQLVRSSLEIIKQEVISPNVVRGLELDSERRLNLIAQLVPKMLRQLFRQFAGVKGSQLYKGLRSGGQVYVSYALQKPSRPV